MNTTHQPITVTPAVARRMAITAQRLAGPPPPASPDADTLYNAARSIGCMQLDPISVVARNHQLVMYSRVGSYDPAHLDTLLWERRSLFEYWAHAASIVLTEDYPIHNHSMRVALTGDTGYAGRARAWVESNSALRDNILMQLREKGPLLSREIEDTSVKGWRSSGWTEGRNVSRMLDYLWSKGIIMVAGRRGGQKMWDLAERCLPDWTPREQLTAEETTYRAAQISLRSLGVGTARHITGNYICGRYPHLDKVMARLESEGKVRRVQIKEEGDSKAWPGEWYVHAEDIAVLERISAGEWQPRTTLLSPFDNLIYSRKRAETLFDYSFRIEIYVPKEQRRYGYYVLSVLHGDRLIGRVDPTMDRKNKRLSINAVHAEPGAPPDKETGRAVRGAIEDLAAFLGAREIRYGERLPEGWSTALRS